MLEIVQNAVEAGAPRIDLVVAEDTDGIRCAVSDNGCGMTAAQRAQCLNPYYTAPGKHPGRSVGLGLSLLAQLIEATGGRLEIDSAPGRGTRVTAWFRPDHVDTPPAGAWDDLFVAALCFNGDYELSIDRRRTPPRGGAVGGYTLTRSEVREALGALDDIVNVLALRTFLRGKEEDLKS